MRLKQSVNLLLIALFVWAFQNTTIHYQHHVLEKVSECNLCHTAEQIELYQHTAPVDPVEMSNENLAVKIRREAEKVVVTPKFDYTGVPSPKYIKILNNQEQTVGLTPLGFNATAPPVYFS